MMPETVWLQLWLHVLGDYITQSHWMAINKTSRLSVAFLHAAVYSLPFTYVLRPSLRALLVIFLTHAIIDRYRLAKYVVFIKNTVLSPSDSDPKNSWEGAEEFDERGNVTKRILGCRATGFPAETPPHISFWLLIIVDNFMHITINVLALWYL